MAHLDIGMLEELFLTVFVHLDGVDVLFLLDVNVSNVHPHIAEFGRGFAHARKNVAGLVEVTLMGQNSAHSIGRPNIPWVLLQDL